MPSMAGGGAEKMISYISNKLIENKNNKVILILFEKTGENLENLSSNLRIVNLKTKIGIVGMISLIRVLRIEQPDIAFFALGPLNAVFSPFILFFKKVKFIARETNIPSIINKLQSKKKKIYLLINLFYKITYNFFDIIIVQSQDMKEDLKKNYNIAPHKLIVINNLIDSKLISTNKKLDLESIELLYREKKIYGLAMGRLTQQKGYDLLVEQLKGVDKNIVIYILGNGELKDKLIEKIYKYKLENNIKILPFDRNPYKYLAKSDFFILPSRVEGFPNALIEALGCGVPAIVNNCKGGINEIIIEGVNGKILDFNQDVDIAKNIREVIKYNRNWIIKDTFNRFNKEIILKKYMQLFE